MIKKINIALLFNIIQLLSFSQFNYFNERYDTYNNIRNAGKSVVEINEGFIIGGSTGHPSNEGWFQISLLKTDLNGNLIYEYIIGDLEAERDLASQSMAIKGENDIYFTGTHRVHTTDWVHDQCLLIKINNSLDVMWTKYFGEVNVPYDTAYLARNLTICSDNGFLIIGDKMPYALQSKIFLIKTDETGEKEWETQYGTGSYYYQGFSAIQTTDGGYAIGGYRFHIGQNETADPFIYKTDSFGNLEWEKNLGGPYFDFHPMLTQSNDGNIVAGTCIADSMLSPNYSYSKIYIVKMDNQGNVIWEKKYGQPEISNVFFQIRTDNDGSFIASGALVNEFPHYSGWLMKIDNNGDSLWYRQYDNLTGNASHNYLYDVIPTSDNGFAACGYVIPYAPDTGSQDAWVLKVDSMGCDTPGCFTTGIREEWFVKSEGELRVWPNPTTNKFEVRSSEFGVGGKKIIRLYNSQGLKVEEIKVPDGVESMEVDVSKYTSGLYYLQYIHSNKIVETVKLIKN